MEIDAALREIETAVGPKGWTRNAADLAPWLTDWRDRYHGAALAMASPASTEEVRRIVSLCAAAAFPIVPQGGNTSMVGGATPPGGGNCLLLSLRRMSAIRAVMTADNALVAEAGAVLANVHAAAAQADRRFPLSLGAKGSATVGGLVSTNAGGTQVLRFGPMRSLVLGLEAVLPDGSLFESLSPLRKDNRGYDLKQLLIGAEGTLGVVTAATLKLVPAFGSRAVAWVGLDVPGSALRLLRRLETLLGDSVESFELVPDEALRLVLLHIPGTRSPLERMHRWNVLVETTAPQGAADARGHLEAALARCLDEGLFEDAATAASEAQADALWRLRDSISEAERSEGPSAKHDISVPVSAMAQVMEAGRSAVESRFPGASVLAFGHLGDGNIHFNVRPPRGTDGAAWLGREGAEATRLVHDLVGEAGGSISAEHGIGQMKREELARTAPERLATLAAIKRALDPQGIMNPGKLLSRHCFSESAESKQADLQ
jgi:FAD/FMN-containing dehydrogenase